jgi:hypothetical protein
MTLARGSEAAASDGQLLNSTLRARSHPVRGGGLAAELFAGFGRLDGPPGDVAAARSKVRGRGGAAPAAQAQRKPAAGRRARDRAAPDVP